MAYIDPRMVTSPKGRVERLDVIFDGGEGDYAVANMLWDGQPATGVRWNGGDQGEKFQGLAIPRAVASPLGSSFPIRLRNSSAKIPRRLCATILRLGRVVQ